MTEQQRATMRALTEALRELASGNTRDWEARIKRARVALSQAEKLNTASAEPYKHLPEFEKIGRAIAAHLDLKPNQAGHYATRYGNKSALGLYLSVKKILDGVEQ